MPDRDAVFPERLAVPPLRSGGIMLGYQCNLSCRHCNYRCRPGAGEWMEEDMLELILDTLAGEQKLIDIHLSGGEATLNRDLLELAVARCRDKKIRLSYLETNGFFAGSVDSALKVFLPLKKAGLNAVLVSVSPYHNEKIPLRHTLNCLEAGVEVFGHDGVFPWLAHFIPMLARLDPETPHSLEEFMDANHIRPDDGSLLRLFPLTPGGRVPDALRGLFRPQPAENFRVGHCLDILTGVDHFHIDPDGNLFTGHCPGIVAARVPDLHHEKELERDPVFVNLALGGPHALMETARRLYRFAPDETGYISPCDLCLKVRGVLAANDPEAWPELGPATFYPECPRGTVA